MYLKFGKYQEFDNTCIIERPGLIGISDESYHFERIECICSVFDEIEVILGDEVEGYNYHKVYLIPYFSVNVGDTIDGQVVERVVQVADRYEFRVIKAICTSY